MEKKNTMLLTVIAVATLLVAVVGATFAYFSLTIEGNATTTNATVTTGGVATLTYKEGTKSATLTVTASDMAKPDSERKYYATINPSSTDSETGGIWIGDGTTVVTTHEEDKTIDLGGVELASAGEEKYSCTYKITITDKTSENKLLDVDSEDLFLVMTADQSVSLSGITASEETNLKTLLTGGPKEITGTFELDSKNTSKSFDAQVFLKNKITDQSTLAGKTLNLEFKTEANCELKATTE